VDARPDSSMILTLRGKGGGREGCYQPAVFFFLPKDPGETPALPLPKSPVNPPHSVILSSAKEKGGGKVTPQILVVVLLLPPGKKGGGRERHIKPTKQQKKREGKGGRRERGRSPYTFPNLLLKRRYEGEAVTRGGCPPLIHPLFLIRRKSGKKRKRGREGGRKGRAEYLTPPQSLKKKKS